MRGKCKCDYLAKFKEFMNDSLSTKWAVENNHELRTLVAELRRELLKKEECGCKDLANVLENDLLKKEIEELKIQNKAERRDQSDWFNKISKVEFDNDQLMEELAKRKKYKDEGYLQWEQRWINICHRLNANPVQDDAMSVLERLLETRDRLMQELRDIDGLSSTNFHLTNKNKELEKIINSRDKDIRMQQKALNELNQQRWVCFKYHDLGCRCGVPDDIFKVT